MKNYALLRKTMEHIEAYPEEWDQSTWIVKTSCGTTACFAGWAVLLSGAVELRKCDSVCCSDHSMRAYSAGVPCSMATVAADELGLSSYEASQLFAGSNSMSRLRSVVDRYLAEEATQ